MPGSLCSSPKAPTSTANMSASTAASEWPRARKGTCSFSKKGTCPCDHRAGGDADGDTYLFAVRKGTCPGGLSRRTLPDGANYLSRQQKIGNKSRPNRVY